MEESIDFGLDYRRGGTEWWRVLSFEKPIGGFNDVAGGGSQGFSGGIV